MVKNTKKKEVLPPESNGHLERLIEAQTTALGELTRTTKDLQDQIDEMRDKKSDDGGAKKLIADNLYNTPRARLREYSNISNSAVEPFSLAGTCGAVLDEDVLSGEISLCEIFLENVLSYRRAVGGQLARFASEQAKEEAQKSAENIDAEDARVHGI